MPPVVAIILNGISCKKRSFYQDIYPALSKKLDLEVFETQRAGHASELSNHASKNGFEFIVAAGGDGTLNQIVNGALLSGRDPILGLIPLGTGNDFAKMCGLRADPSSFLELISNEPKHIDIGKIACADHTGAPVVRYFINACSIGMGPAVVKRLEKSDRSLGPLLTYWKAITTTFFTHKPQQVECKTPHWSWNGKIRVLVVANGQSFGNSLHVAPDGKPDDGILNTFIAGEVPLLNFLIYQQTLKTKNKISDPLIHYNQATQVALTAPSICPIESEGELAGFLPARIDVLPGRVRFLR